MMYVYGCLSFFGGMVLAAAFFGSLLFQLKKFLNFKSSAIVLFGFFFRYLAMAASLFLLFKYGDLQKILLFFAGFILVLTVMFICLFYKKGKKSYEN